MALGRILFLVFLIIPLVEIAFFVIIGNAIGLWPTLAGVVITAVIGSLVLRQQGMAVFRDFQGQMGRGQVPARALGDAALIGMGGFLLLLPGYFSDILGILLLLPPVRSAIYAFLKSQVRVVPVSGFGTQPPPEQPGIIDLDDTDYRQR